MVCSYLENIYEEYIESKLAIDKEIASLEIQLKENIEFIKLLENTTDTGYELFSPRNVNSNNRKQIQELKEKQQDIIGFIEDIDVKKIRIDNYSQYTSGLSYDGMSDTLIYHPLIVRNILCD